LRKGRGAFFTPPELCDYITAWAIRDASDKVLEPSCGEAAFLTSAGRRLQSLGAKSPVLHGVEIHYESARRASVFLRTFGKLVRVRRADFFSVEPTPNYDAVIGNPPYVRYQHFNGDARTISREAALRAGVSLTRLASSWAAFTVHAALFLKPEGRLGLVLPAELLTVNYAAEVRRFLMRRFSSVRLVLFSERVFPEVQEEVVLLLAEGQGPTDHCELYQSYGLSDFPSPDKPGHLWRPSSPAAKWTRSLMSREALETYQELEAHHAFETLDEWGETTLGMVTGNNDYFAVNESVVRHYHLHPDDLLPISPPGSRHLRGLAYGQAAWRRQRGDDARVWLFRPGPKPTSGAARYIADGGRSGVDAAYKCRVRNPWWQVPLVPSPDLFVTYMNADTPRLCANRARVQHLNSVHGLYLRPRTKALGMALLPIAALNSMTLLGAETVGRSYGGGILKLEPKEADLLPIPAVSAVRSAGSQLSGLRRHVTHLLRHGQLMQAVDLVDELLLHQLFRLSRRQIGDLRDSHAELSGRRMARKNGPK
jgi:adenine-specific DNA methylase